jgi:hypothetical protein
MNNAIEVRFTCVGLAGYGVSGAADAIARVPRRTVRRWAGWWSGGFAELPFWQAERGRFAEAVACERLPESLLERFSGPVAAKLLRALCFVAPITTETASWARVVWSRAEGPLLAAPPKAGELRERLEELSAGKLSAPGDDHPDALRDVHPGALVLSGAQRGR